MAGIIQSIEQILPRFAAVHDTMSLGAAALKCIEELVALDSAAIYLVDPRTKDRLELVFVKGLSESERLDAERALPDGTPTRCFQTRQTLTQQQPRPAFFQPVCSGDICIGSFAMFGAQTSQLSDEQRKGLSIIGEICGLTYRQLVQASMARESAEERYRLQKIECVSSKRPSCFRRECQRLAKWPAASDTKLIILLP